MTYQEALLKAVDEWSTDPIEDEWLFEKFREEFVSVMSPSEAFESIPVTLDLLFREVDESTSTEILQTIIALARRSNTTECPARLVEQCDALQEKFSVFGDYARSKQKELFQYYGQLKGSES